jgi:tetratricopeptide (TPR) repeat protein
MIRFSELDSNLTLSLQGFHFMKTWVRRLSSLVVLIFISYGSAPAYAESPPWIEVRSQHFSVITDAGEKRGREVVFHFEQMRAVFSELMTKANVNIPVPLQIVAFRNSKEFKQVAPLWHGKPTQLAGLFQGGEDRSFIMLDMSAENPWSVVFHEYAHQLMSGVVGRQLDPWFEEGFAEYFSTIEVDNKEARVGKPSGDAYLILQQNGMLKIADLFKVRQNSQTYNENGDRRTVFYAESNMLVHYLYDNKLVTKVGPYFDLTAKNVPVEDAIQQAFGMTAAQFDKVFRDYVSGGRYRYYAIPTPANINSSSYTASPISASDSSAVMADIHLHSLDYHDKAIAEFLDILKTDPNNAAACRGLGYGYLQKQEYEQAADYFHRAAQLDSKDPRVHYYSALLMSRQGGFGNREHAPEMIKELETAISLDPNFADPYMLLGFAQLSSGDPAKGLETMKKAIALSPRNEAYQYNLAQAYMGNQKFDEAVALLHALETTQNPELAARVQMTLTQAQQMKATWQRYQEAKDSRALQVRPAPAEADDSAKPADEKPTAAVKKPGPVGFLHGTVLSVDCSAAPVAVMTVVSGAKTWKMKVADTSHVVLQGADKFSCTWSKLKVALNYEVTGSAEGRVISVEIQ